MKIKLQLRVETEIDGQPTTLVEEIGQIERAELKLETLGLNLTEAKNLLATLQGVMLNQQVKEYLAQNQNCPDCGRPYSLKGQHQLVFRTLFGQSKLNSPRFYQCQCHQPLPLNKNLASASKRPRRASFSPLASLLSERSAPELVYLEAKWASLLSYGMTIRLFEEVLPLDKTVSKATLSQQVERVAERLESELGEEQFSFIEGCPQQWQDLPIPEAPLVVGIDGGYIHACKAKEKASSQAEAPATGAESEAANDQKVSEEAKAANESTTLPLQKEEGGNWFELIVGKSIPTEKGKSKSFGFVTSYDTKPKRRVYEVLRSQGMQPNQQVIFMSDGGDSVRAVQEYLNPHSEAILDWFHITMRLTVLLQMARGLAVKPGKAAKGKTAREEDEAALPTPSQVEAELERVKWKVWHGQVYAALEVLEGLDLELEGVEDKHTTIKKLLKSVRELVGYLSANAAYIVNYGERYRNGEKISTGFVESTVNQLISKRFVKKQQMKWTRQGAHLLMQVRVRVIDEELGEIFQRWYPAMQLVEKDAKETLEAAA